ncbi:MAG: TRAP transporter substrate-binding protein DctP [Alcaligenaceae bacterium]|nr:TRAP transporter substrate-binding protein DctP [Alcaligenaceae bacterium]
MLLKNKLKSLVVSTLTAVTMATTANATEIVLTSEVATTHWKTDYMRQFAEAVEKRSNGEVTVKIYAGGQLYNDQDAVAALGTGAVHMVWPLSVRLEAIQQIAGVMNLPFMVTQEHMMNSCYSNGLKEQISSYLKSGGLEALGFLRASDMIFVFRDREIKTTKDINGAKIRVTGGRVFQDLIKAMNASPVSMAASEMSTALAQGAIDGIFTSPAGWSEMIGMVGKYGWYVPELSVTSYAVLVDSEWFRSLPENQQQAIQETIDEIAARQWTESKEADEVLTQKMIDQGATYIVADDDEQKFLRNLVAESSKVFTDRYPESVEALKDLENKCVRTN